MESEKPHSTSPFVLEPTFELLLVTAHRLGVEMDHALCFDAVSTMGLMALSMIIRAREPMTLRLLAAQLGSTQQSAKEIVDRLQRDGLIERSVNPYDRRSKLLIPTPHGRQGAEYAREALAFCMDSFMRTFDADERATFLTSLQRMVRYAHYHRTERLWGLHRMGGPGVPSRRPQIPAPVHVR